MDFCDTVKDRPSRPLETLLKIAETKDALLNWEQAIALLPEQDSHDDVVESIATAIEIARGHIDRAEETILDAFCLSQKRQNVSKVQNA